MGSIWRDTIGLVRALSREDQKISVEQAHSLSKRNETKSRAEEKGIAFNAKSIDQ